MCRITLTVSYVIRYAVFHRKAGKFMVNHLRIKLRPQGLRVPRTFIMLVVQLVWQSGIEPAYLRFQRSMSTSFITATYRKPFWCA